MSSDLGLHGIVPALATPLRPDGTLDERGCRRLIEHVLAGGVHGVLVLGSTGEMAALDHPVRRRLLEVTAEALSSRVPLLVGVAEMTLTTALHEIHAAAAAGAQAALVVPPYYSPIDQPTVLAFYRELATSSPLPILIYNIPGFTKVVVSPEVVSQLAEEGVVAGIKDSSRDFEYIEQVLDMTGDRPGFVTFTGSDTMLLGSLAMGATGAITLSANVAPDWGVRLYDLVRAGRWEDAREQQRRILRLVIALRTGVFPTGIKAALALVGICGDTPAWPATPLGEPERVRLRVALQGLGLLPEAGEVTQGARAKAGEAPVLLKS